MSLQDLQREKQSATSAQTISKQRFWLVRVEAPKTEAIISEALEGTRLGRVLLRGRGSTEKYSVP